MQLKPYNMVMKIELNAHRIVTAAGNLSASSLNDASHRVSREINNNRGTGIRQATICAIPSTTGKKTTKKIEWLSAGLTNSARMDQITCKDLSADPSTKGLLNWLKMALSPSELGK